MKSILILFTTILSVVLSLGCTSGVKTKTQSDFIKQKNLVRNPSVSRLDARTNRDTKKQAQEMLYQIIKNGIPIAHIRNFIITANVDLEAQDKNGKTALHWAASGKMSNSFDIVQMLVEEFGANIKVKDKFKFTPADLAKVNGNKKIYYYLRNRK